MSDQDPFKTRAVNYLTLAVMVIMVIALVACLGLGFAKYLLPWARSCIIWLSFSKAWPGAMLAV
jgi:hypothetical protein